MKRAVVLLLASIGLQGLARAETSLVDVVREGDRATALKLIQAGADVNAAQADGTTPLQWAVYHVDVPLARALIAKGARADTRNVLGATPLAEAAKVADPQLVALLLKAGANADSPNQDGQTALMLAARTGVVAVARQLVEHGASVNAREAWRGQTALMWAAGENHPEMTAYLVAHGARVGVRAAINDWQNQITAEPRAQYRPTAGLTPLLYAVRSGCTECVTTLLKAGADVNQPTPDGVSPLMSAIDNLHFDLARYLLTRGANPHVWDWWGRTALYVATDMHSLNPRIALPPEHPEQTTALDIMKLLLDAGVNPNPQLDMHRPGRGGNSGRFTDDSLTAGATPLLRAAIAYDNEAIQLLLAHGALVDLPNVMGVTPLMVASGLGVSIRDLRGVYNADAGMKALATLEILLKAGADVNARVLDTSGRTARIARPSSMTNRQGQTALYGAINWGWAPVVEFLLAHGARVDITDAAGKTPLNAVAGDAGGRDHKPDETVAALIRKASQGG